MNLFRHSSLVYRNLTSQYTIPRKIALAIIISEMANILFFNTNSTQQQQQQQQQSYSDGKINSAESERLYLEMKEAWL